MGSLLDGTNLTLGTCYYPEHWDEAMWEGDLAEMKRSGIEVVRVAEFAWSKIEPREGEFEFGFFDRFLDLAQRMGIRVIFSTPTATPPAWLTEQYPEVLNATIDGALIRHGSRRHYNYNSEIYRKYVRRIVEKSASCYGKHPAVIGWQIDNEFNCENYVFYSESDTVAFRGFLKDKYGTVERLNRAWGTVFWNPDLHGVERGASPPAHEHRGGQPASGAGLRKVYFAQRAQLCGDAGRYCAQIHKAG